MAGEKLTINPISEDPTNSPLELVDADHGYYLLAHEYPMPPIEPQYAGSMDTEGDTLVHNRYRNREISATVRVREPNRVAQQNCIVNPSAEKDTQGWSVSGGAISRTDAWSHNGDYSLRHFGTGTTDNLIAADFVVEEGDWVDVSAWVYVELGPLDVVYFQFDWLQSDGTYISTSSADPTSAAFAINDETFVYDSHQAPALAGRCTVYFTPASDTPHVYDYYLDSVIAVRNGDGIPLYFDGDTPGCSWLGAPHYSMSTRPGTGGDRFYALLDDLEQVVSRINREKRGQLRRVYPDGRTITFDLLDATMDFPNDKHFMTNRRTDVQLKFTARPFGRENPIIYEAETNSTPLGELELADVPGDVPALGRLILTDEEGEARRFTEWGLEQKYYNPADPTPLLIDSQVMTVADAVGIIETRDGAYDPEGGVFDNTLRATAYDKAQPLAGMLGLEHIGSYKVVGRFYCEAPVDVGTPTEVRIRLRYRVGGGAWRESVWKTPNVVGQWGEIDFGVITIPTAKLGDQSWDYYFDIMGDALGDDVDVDYTLLIPIIDGYGRSTAAPPPSGIFEIQVRDNFDSLPYGDPLDARVTSLGAETWDSSGAGMDFTAADGPDNRGRLAKFVGRWSIDDTGTGKLSMLAGSYGEAEIGCDIWVNSPLRSGQYVSIQSRFVDADNHLQLTAFGYSPVHIVYFNMTYLGVSYNLGNIVMTPIESTWVNYRLITYASGHVYADLRTVGASAPQYSLSAYHPLLATGGALEAGEVGIRDYNATGQDSNRFFDNFSVASITTPQESVCMEADQSIEFRWDATLKENMDGNQWGSPPVFSGDRFYVPHAGRENRVSRLAYRAARSRVEVADSLGITDATGAQAIIVPRHITVPR